MQRAQLRRKIWEGNEMRPDVPVHLAAAARRQVQLERKVGAQRLQQWMAARATMSARRGMKLQLVRIGNASD